MKPNIHPNYQPIQVTCSCGNKFTTGSTLGKDLHVEVCSACHPFFTGKQKIVDTAGRVERFKDKFSRLPSSKTKAESEVKTSAPVVEAKPAPVSTEAASSKTSETKKVTQPAPAVKASAAVSKAKSAAAPKAKAAKEAGKTGEKKKK